MEEWVEARGRSVEQAVQVAIEELGLSSPEDAKVEVLEEPERGFLGLGGRDAVVRVSKKSSGKRRRRRGRGGRGSGGDRSGEQSRKGQAKAGAKEKEERRREGRRGDGRPGSDKSKSDRDERRSAGGDRQPKRSDRRDRPVKDAGAARPQKSKRQGKPAPDSGSTKPREEAAAMPDLNEQAEVIEEFLTGLLDAFGLEGEVATRVEDEIIIADVTGDQTEALIGPKGSILQSIRELTRTVVQRKTQSGARIRLDIGGYVERRREALGIYAARLADQVLEEGGEVMLEPMNPADRKVVHDAIAEIEGVRSYSEGEEPHRSVVLSPVSDD